MEYVAEGAEEKKKSFSVTQTWEFVFKKHGVSMFAPR